MNFNYQKCLNKAQDFRLDIPLTKSLFFQITSIDDAQNLMLFLRKEQNINAIDVIRYLICFFDLDLPAAALLYQEFNPNTKASQTQFKDMVLTGEKLELLKIIADYAELINLFFMVNNPLELVKILTFAEKKIKAVSKKIKQLVELDILHKTKKEKQNAYLYQLNPVKAAEIKNILQIG